MICKRCGGRLERKERQFFWKGLSFPGIFCEACHALFEDPDQPFVKRVAELSDPTRNW